MAVRELDKHELIVVAGGLWYQNADGSWVHYLERASVTAPEDYEAPMEPYQSPNYIPDEYDAWDVGDEQGGSDGAEGPEVESVKTEEQMIDELAQNLATQIMAMPDWQQREYVAVIYKLPDGTVVATAIRPGLTDGTASEATKLALDEAGGVANLANIIGIIHNHPQKLVDDADNKPLASDINKMPSDKDWVTAEYLFEDRTDFAWYIVGPDGELREYENSDRALWDARNEPSYYNTHENLYDKWLDSEQGVIP